MMMKRMVDKQSVMVMVEVNYVEKVSDEFRVVWETIEENKRYFIERRRTSKHGGRKGTYQQEVFKVKDEHGFDCFVAEELRK